MEQEITLSGDREITHIPSIKDKTLRINLNNNIYGTFAEIGAGQETVRHFFRVGGASKTIAKAMSAYDKDFSDDIYGIEADGRYVTESRLKKMLSHEKQLVEDRLNREKHPTKMFFSYANTVATIDFAKKNKGHGWVGLTYQIAPDAPYNEIILHIKFRENDAKLQQETLGILGVNLIYGAYYYYNNPTKLLRSLYDNLNKDQIEIDTINFQGPQFKEVDNRLMSLHLVSNGMTEAVIFRPNGKNVFPADVLYNKNILALRGSFRPVTLVNMNMYKKSYVKFMQENQLQEADTEVIFEITLSNLSAEGSIDEQDFLDRAQLLCDLGQTVLISNFPEYYKLVEYFSQYPIKKIGLILGVQSLIDIFEEKYYTHLSGGLLEAFGKLFYKDLKIYLYPMEGQDGEVIDSQNLKVSENMKELYKFFAYNNRVVDIDNYERKNLKIFSKDVLAKIQNQEAGWELMVPEGIADIIKARKLFLNKETQV